MDALRAEAGVRTPRVLPAADGRRVVTVAGPGRPAGDAARGHCVRFEYLPGTEPGRTGAAAGALRRARRDHRADAPARPGLGPAGLVHPVPAGTTTRRSARRPRWGRWQDGIGVGPAERRCSGGWTQRCRAGWPRSAPGPSGSGWCTPTPGWPTCWSTSGSGQRHRLRRLRVQLVPVRRGHRGQLLRAQPHVPGAGRQLAVRLPAGWHGLPAADEAEIWTFILFRRLLLVAWIGSHPARRHRRRARRRIHPGQLRPGRAVPQPGRRSVHGADTEGNRMFTSIAGRAVVVTGATRGIGKGIAGVFARSGARVLITGRDEDAAKATVAELAAAGGEVSYVLADVARGRTASGSPPGRGRAARRHRRAVRQRRDLPRRAGWRT